MTKANDKNAEALFGKVKEQANGGQEVTAWCPGKSTATTRIWQLGYTVLKLWVGLYASVGCGHKGQTLCVHQLLSVQVPENAQALFDVILGSIVGNGDKIQF